jgi:L-alanine-DL-glutamate epimerase-like enolase superfamily enzyme
VDCDPFRIVALQAWECVVDLPAQLILGRTTYKTRDYQVVRIELDNGAIGTAVGYTRTVPMHAVLGRLCESLAGEVFASAPGPYEHLRAGFGLTWPSVLRSASLIDVAVWDAVTRHRDLPLYKALGGKASSVDVAAVCGYYPDERSAHDIGREANELVSSGYRNIKVLAPRTDEAALVRYVETVLRTVGDRAALAVDFYGAWSNAHDALPALSLLDSLGLHFIEDPLPVGTWREYQRLSAELRTPIAAGEDLVGPLQLEDLILSQAVKILRVDVTASGGFSGILGIVNSAAAAGLLVLPHVFPALHGQLAGTGSVTVVELIPVSVATDPLNRLLTSGSSFPEAGRVNLNDRGAGHGMDFDWAAVEATSRASVVWKLT